RKLEVREDRARATAHPVISFPYRREIRHEQKRTAHLQRRSARPRAPVVSALASAALGWRSDSSPRQRDVGVPAADGAPPPEGSDRARRPDGLGGGSGRRDGEARGAPRSGDGRGPGPGGVRSGVRGGPEEVRQGTKGTS